MRMCACEHVTAEREEGGGRREANRKVCASKQVSTLSLFKAFFSINPGFQPTKHEPLSPRVNTMEVWCPAAISFDFFCDFKK